MSRAYSILGCRFFLVAFCSLSVLSVTAQDTADLKKELDDLRQQNRLLQNQLQQQQDMINQLSQKFSEFQQTNAARENNLPAKPAEADDSSAAPPKSKGFTLGNVVISGEGAAGFFETGKNGQYPNAPFRVDEARFFVDAPIWDNVYFYGQLDLITPQSPDAGLYLGELYVEAEGLAKHWDMDQLLNLRIGNLYIPFGEEYQNRFAIDDPLISHSLSDLWGYNPGLELYGSWKKMSYVVAVQNGGISTLNDNTADKSIAGRIGYDPASWLHFSVSAMRTGKLSAAEDISAMWFGDGLFQSIGSPTTTVFRVSLGEADAAVKWKSGYAKAAGGGATYDDNDPTADNHRNIYYYYLEALQHLTPKIYGVTRFSQIRADGGYPIVGDTPTFGLPTSDLWRLSLGLGYHFNDHLIWKVEYMFEQGRLSTGGARDHENMIATEAAFKF